jgi:adenosylcobinamide-GDP ribazoletransferase
MKDQLYNKNESGLRLLVAELAHCLAFLTRIPLPANLPFELPALNQAMRHFPVIGALVGCLTALVVCLSLALGLPSFIAATLGIAVTVALTGGLHEDGLADTADGFGGSGKDRKLAIMRDSRIGTYGVLALVFTILLKVQAMSVVTAQPAWAIAAELAAIGAFSRALMVWLMRTSLPARGDGLAASAGRPSQASMMYALSLGSISTLLAFWIALGLSAGIIALAMGFALAMVIRSLANWQIGGYTGDTCGAMQVMSETAMLIATASMIS